VKTRRPPFVFGGPWERRALHVGIDVVVVAAAFFLSFLLRFDGEIPVRLLPMVWRTLILAVGIKIPVFLLLRLYRFSWRYVGLAELLDTGTAVAIGSAVLAAVLFTLGRLEPWSGVPRSVLGIDFVFALVGVGGVRLSRRMLDHLRKRSAREGDPTLVVGAGDAGVQLVRAIREDSEVGYRVVGFVDDDVRKRGMVLRGVRVLGPREHLRRLVSTHGITTILIAMPASPAAVIRDTIDLARQAGVRDVKILPSLSQLYTGRVAASELREVRPEDLLQREPTRIDTEQITGYLDGRTVLVTGAAGSIGSEICRQVLRFGAGRLVALDFNETGLFYLHEELTQRFPNRSCEIIVADVRDHGRIASVVSSTSPHVVYHAAAYKHVPMMEAFPSEAVKTNVMGTRNVLEEACRSETSAFVLMSTDKAVNPTSVMGATKRVAEMIVRSRADHPDTRCVAVRFGNVLGSRGSVLQTFVDQIERRQPITITHPDMQRYFMITSEAVQLVLQAGVLGRGGEVLVLDMGEPVEIEELARELIRFYGLRPEQDVPIVYTGVRPGEKFHEELLTAEEGTDATAHERLFVARMTTPSTDWARDLAVLEKAALDGDDPAVIGTLRRLVPSYRSSEGRTQN
jgi:FlaA1/EpsC-like NDP-sugar epimerase